MDQCKTSAPVLNLRCVCVCPHKDSSTGVCACGRAPLFLLSTSVASFGAERLTSPPFHLLPLVCPFCLSCFTFARW